jgi:MFS superfamily sulfate permease-like transporter
MYIFLQGVAYGVLAGAPAQYGLYACIFPAAVYAVLGNCPQLSLGM